MAGQQQFPEPIRRSIAVSWDQTAAFERFTSEFGTWWPTYSHSIGGRRVKRLVFECRVGGLIYEEHHDGTKMRWGTVTVFDPPNRVAFTFHPSREESDAQLIEVRFLPEGAGTRVELVSSGWEKMGRTAQRAYGAYRLNWGAALDRFAKRFSGVVVLFSMMSAGIDLIGQRGTFIRNSHGMMPPGKGSSASM
jgi:activator of Hsp90 ATPase-like protein